MISKRIFSVIIICVLFTSGGAQTCIDGFDVLGTFDVTSLSNALGTSTGTQFVMTDNEYLIPCCGVVTSWKINAVQTGTIIFQVWRPDGAGTNAELIGQNSATVSSLNEYTYTVPVADQIEVDGFDVIGWYTPGQEIVSFQFAAGENDNNYVEDISQPSVGDTITPTTLATDRTYAIYATLDAKPAPSITNLNATVYEYAASISTVTPIYTVTAAFGFFTLESISPSSHFSISSTTGEVTATTTSVSMTTYTLTISAGDYCSYRSEGILTITITPPDPVWDNLDATLTISTNDVSTTTPSYTVLATESVTNSSIAYTLQSISPSAHFKVDASSGDVTATTSYAYTNDTTYVLVIRATDAYGHYADGTLTLNVFYLNNVPVINSLPDVIDVSETAVDETFLHTINVTDIDGDLVTCQMTPSPSGPFTTKYLSINSVFTTGIYLTNSPNLNYSATNAYELSVTCSDDTSTSDTALFYVYVTPNNVPTIANLPNATSILSSTSSTTTIYQIASTDPENDSVYFSLACTIASSCPFAIYSDGAVVLTTSLLSTTSNAYELDISVRDDYSSSGNHRLTVFVTDLNTQPRLTNLPATLQITEDTSVGSTLFDTLVYDEDGDTSHTFTAFFIPSTSSALFQLNQTTGEIVLATALNYLTQDNNYTLSITVSDSLTSSNSDILTIEVVDVNQAPVLYQTNYRVDADEGSAGTESPDPGFNLYDPDSDTLTYSWGGGNDTSGFSINTTNGIVSFAVDFDADDTSIDTLYIWLVVIADPDGLSTTATLTLSILDTNDNVPEFSSTYYAAIISSTAQLATSVLSVQSTDTDKSPEYQELEYSIHSTNLFLIDHSGNILVYGDLGTYADTVENFYIRVKNPDVNSYDTAYISISILEEDGDDFFDNTANIVWVTLVCILGPIVLVGVAYLGYLAYQKWVASSMTKGQVTQVAPYNTRMPPKASPPPYTPSRGNSRASLVTRGTAVVTPRDVDVVNESWEGWRGGSWQA